MEEDYHRRLEIELIKGTKEVARNIIEDLKKKQYDPVLSNISYYKDKYEIIAKKVVDKILQEVNGGEVSDGVRNSLTVILNSIVLEVMSKAYPPADTFYRENGEDIEKISDFLKDEIKKDRGYFDKIREYILYDKKSR